MQNQAAGNNCRESRKKRTSFNAFPAGSVFPDGRQILLLIFKQKLTEFFLRINFSLDESYLTMYFETSYQICAAEFKNCMAK